MSKRHLANLDKNKPFMSGPGLYTKDSQFTQSYSYSVQCCVFPTQNAQQATVCHWFIVFVFKDGTCSLMSSWQVILFQLRFLAPITHQSLHTSRHLQSSLITKTEKSEMTNRDCCTHAMYLPNFKLFYFAL